MLTANLKRICAYFLLLFLFPMLHLQGQDEMKISDDGSIKSIFYDDGILAVQKWYGDDKKIDSLKAYYNTGELDEEFYYKKGHYSGTCFKYNKAGEKMVTWEFEKGNLLTRTDHIIEFDKKNEEKVNTYHSKLKKLNELIMDNPRSTKLIYNRARFRSYLKSYTLAISDFKMLERKFGRVECDETHARIMDYLSNLYSHYEMENYTIHYKLKAIKKSPSKSSFYNNLGVYFVKKQDYQLGIEYLEQATDMAPNHSFANLGLSIAYSDLGEYEKAMACVNIAFKREKQLIKLGSGDSERHLRTTRGFLYHKLGDSQKGIEDLEEALDINENNSFALKNLGIIYYDLEKYDKACEFLKKSQQLGYEKIYDRDDLTKYLDASCQEKNTISNRTLNDQPLVYPNPVQDAVYIKNFQFENFNFNVYSYDSKLLKSGKANGNSINFSDFIPGLYLLEIEKNGVKHLLKVVKK